MSSKIVPRNDALARCDLADGRVEGPTTASFATVCLTGNGLRGKRNNSGIASTTPQKSSLRLLHYPLFRPGSTYEPVIRTVIMCLKVSEQSDCNLTG
jgi:hypothetical protein